MRQNSRSMPRDILIRNVPPEIHSLLEKTARENHRSKGQEALVALTNGLTTPLKPLKKPKPFQWKSKLTTKTIQDAIEEGRE